MISDDRLLEDRQTFPLTRQQFDRLWSRVQRRMAWVLGVGFVTFILAMLLTGPAMTRAGIASDSIWRDLPAIVVILVAFFVFVWLCQDPRLRCPNCKQSLVGGMSPHIVIVTGRCPKCAATFYQDEAGAIAQESAEVTGATLLTQAELLAAERGVRRAAVPRTMKWVLTGAILLALGGASAVLLKDVVASRLGEVWAPFVFPVFLAPGIVVGSWAVAVGGRDVAVVAKRCPHCSAEITSRGFAVITGNCPRCGQQAVSDPFPGMPPTSPTQGVSQWSLAEFRGLAEPCRDRLWIGCLVGAGLNVLWYGPLLIAIAADQRLKSSLEGSAVRFACTLAVGFCQCGGVVLWRWYSARGICCPACQRSLVDFYRLVISSHRCYHCGAAVIAPQHGGARW